MPKDETALTGTASQLASQISKIVDLTRQPVPMDHIRQLARTLAGSSYDERHYLQYSQWFCQMVFADGSHITFGEEEI